MDQVRLRAAEPREACDLTALAHSSNLTNGLHAVGEYGRAHQFDEDTLTRCRWVLGDDHPHTLTAAHNLARDLHALGEHQQARQLEEYVRAHRKG